MPKDIRFPKRAKISNLDKLESELERMHLTPLQNKSEDYPKKQLELRVLKSLSFGHYVLGYHLKS